MIEPVISAAARALDSADELASLRARFHLPLAADGKPAIYLCGNSLGPQPIGAGAAVQQVMTDWATLAVRGHHEGRAPWLRFHEQFAAPLAELVGAQAHEVVAMNSLTVNLHLMLVSFFRPTASRHRVLIERPAFPSDRHAVVSHLLYHGLEPERSLLEVGPPAGEDLLQTADILAAIETAGESLALVLLPGVQYLTGQVLDGAAITAAARRQGACVGWDLAHAIGNVPLSLHDCGADFAVWCHYKYLCAGPGAVGGAFVHARHGAGRDLPRYAGWWGHDLASRFEMGPHHRPSPGADGWQLSNPPILSLAPLAAALEIYRDADMARLRAKSLRLTAHARLLIEQQCAASVTVLTPVPDAERGCQLSLRIAGGAGAGRRVHAELMHHGVICDWREPDVIRIAPSPLYNSFAELDQAIGLLAAALAAR